MTIPPIVSFTPLQATSQHNFGTLIQYLDDAPGMVLTGIENLEQHDSKNISLNGLRVLKNVISPLYRTELLFHLGQGAPSMASITKLAGDQAHKMWVDWHWEQAPDNLLHPTISMPSLHRSGCLVDGACWGAYWQCLRTGVRTIWD